MSSLTADKKPPPRRGEARERVLEEATPLFQTRGFADVSMQRIADAVGITKAALYYHFHNKEDLFAEVARRIMQRNFAGIIERAEAEGPLRESLASIVEHVLDIHEEHAGWAISDDLQRHLPPDAVGEILSGQPAALEEAIHEMFQRASAAGDLRPLNTAIVSTLFLGMLMALSHGTQDPWEIRQRQPGDEDVLIDIFLHGIAAS